MSTTIEQPKEENPEENIKSFISPSRELEASAPFRWLAKGWNDFRRAPGASLAYGVIMALISVFISFWAYHFGSITMVIVMMAGFIFIGPAMAMGLYSISCQLEKKNRVDFFTCIKQGKKRLGNQMILAFALLLVFLVWARAASMVHIFFLNKKLGGGRIQGNKHIFAGTIAGIFNGFSSTLNELRDGILVGFIPFHVNIIT